MPDDKNLETKLAEAFYCNPDSAKQAFKEAFEARVEEVWQMVQEENKEVESCR